MGLGLGLILGHLGLGQGLGRTLGLYLCIGLDNENNSEIAHFILG